MADLDTVRMLIADAAVNDRAVAVGDGLTTVFQLPNYPVVTASAVATVNGAPVTITSVDLESGLVTLAAAPVDGAEVALVYRHTLLSDATITNLLTLEGSVKLAAAQALEIIGTNEVLVQKRIQILDLQTDGPAVAAALAKRAQQLRDEAAAGVGAVAADFDGAFDVAEVGWDANTRGDIRWRAWQN